MLTAVLDAADKAWPIVKADSDWFVSHGSGKKMYWDENGWPSKHYSGVEPNSPDAVSDIPNEQVGTLSITYH